MSESHPWDEFLKARVRTINWMGKAMKYDNAQIAKALSMDEFQVYLIKSNPINQHYFEENFSEEA